MPTPRRRNPYPFALVLGLAAFAARSADGQAFAVSAVNPARLARGISPASGVTLTFTTAVPAATFSFRLTVASTMFGALSLRLLTLTVITAAWPPSIRPF